MQTFPQKLLLLGSGELGKEITIAAKRIGCTVIACDRYSNAPAMQVADISEHFDMTNPKILKDIIIKYQPDLVIPEIEALGVEALKEVEDAGIQVIPNAKATSITMNRDLIRDLASKQLGLKTANFSYANNPEELKKKSTLFKWPIIIKPVMSSSGKGQSLVKKPEELEAAWNYAIAGARGESKKVIIEEFINFDLEITLLTIKQKNGLTLFCDPIGHEQIGGDYQCSWQPAEVNEQQLKEAKSIAKVITDELGGVGLFGVEFFICKDNVIFSELSPRPHDTGLVTIISQNINEFELHLRAILGLPIPSIIRTDPSASRVILANNSYESISYEGLEKALSIENSQILLFGKPNSKKNRRMGVALAQAKTIDKARLNADQAAKYINILKGK